MQIINCEQRSEVWEQARLGIPTASQFSRLGYDRTKKKLGKGARTYLCELLAQRAGVWIEQLPNFWMERGTELEPEAVAEYEKISGRLTVGVGFVRHELGFGCSPDRFIGSDGLLEIKCPAPQTHVGFILDGVLPDDYVAQVYGQMWICEREWCDFFSYCEGLKPFILRVSRDSTFDKWLAKFEPLMNLFLSELEAAWEAMR